MKAQTTSRPTVPRRLQAKVLERLDVAPYLRLMRLDRPVGSLLLLWPTLAALWMAADGLPPRP